MQVAIDEAKLLKLADFLETVVPAKQFDLESWVQADPTVGKKEKEVVEGNCGFSGCAMGWAAHARLFPGFRLGRIETGSDFLGRTYRTVNRAPVYKGGTGFDAIQVLFGISYNAATYLFVDTSYPGHSATPKQVAKRIRRFVKIEREAAKAATKEANI